MSADCSTSPTGTLTSGGKSLEYACWGPGPDTAPTIVLLHEGLGCVALWRDFPQRLADATGWGVFAFSRAGYGQSDPAVLPRPLDYMTVEAIDVLPEVLNQIGFRTGILFGHSDGATIAAIHAGSVVDHRVRGLVLMAPHFFTEPMGLAAIAEARMAWEKGDLSAKLGKYHANDRGFMSAKRKPIVWCAIDTRQPVTSHERVMPFYDFNAARAMAEYMRGKNA